MGEENGEQALSKKSSPQLGDPLNMTEWIEDNKSFFLPPVCNKMMWVLCDHDLLFFRLLEVLIGKVSQLFLIPAAWHISLITFKFI